MVLLEPESKDLNERELESKIRKSPHLIEPGLRFVASQRRVGRGPLDLLLVDSGDALIVAELKTEKNDKMLFQGVDYYDYVSSNLEALALAYESKGFHIDALQTPRLMLIAPSFSQTLVNRCKWLDIPIDLYRYKAMIVRKEGEEIGELLDFLPVEIPARPQREEVYTRKKHIEYITDRKMRTIAKDFLQKVSEWEGVTLDAIKYHISMKVKGNVFAYFSPRRDGFLIEGYSPEHEWQNLAKVGSPEELEDAISATKDAYENIKK